MKAIFDDFRIFRRVMVGVEGSRSFRSGREKKEVFVLRVNFLSFRRVSNVNLGYFGVFG